MKHYYFAAIWLVCQVQPEIVWAQNLAAPCGSDYWRAKALQDPAFFQKNLDYEQGILQVFQDKKASTGQPEQIKYIPVVVHIIHDEGPENITDIEVQQAMEWLNQALANQGNFDRGSGMNANIQVCLAQRNPDGQSTNGITRNQSVLTDMNLETQDIQLKNLNRWETTEYLNIWLVRSICSDNYGCGVYGYSNYPFAHGSIIDGIVIEAGYLTAIGKISGLAHEIGHYLGLFHTFEDGCTNNNCLTDGDRICDTPPDQSTANVPCSETVNTCNTDTQSGPFTIDQPDITWNFMDYGYTNCLHDYTPNQVTRMNATLQGVRHSLLDSKGCIPPCADNISVTLCPNLYFNYRGVLVPVDTVAFFHLIGYHGCDSVVTVTVFSHPPLNMILPMDTTIRIGASILLDTEISGTNPLNFAWSPKQSLSCSKCPDPIANPLESITYTLAVTDGNKCVYERRVNIHVNEECRTFIPNAFTPNDDGMNDRFRPIMDSCVQVVNFWRIVNRWGKTVFEQIDIPATDPNLGWDGNLNGKPYPADVLIWLAEFEYFDGRRESKRGEVTLIR